MSISYELTVEEAITLFVKGAKFSHELQDLFPELDQQKANKYMLDFAQGFFIQLQQQDFTFHWLLPKQAEIALNPDIESPLLEFTAKEVSGFLQIQRKFSSPAKLNSFLNIMSKDLGNNYHNMLSFFQFIDFSDEFTLSLDLYLSADEHYWGELDQQFKEDRKNTLAAKLEIAYQSFLSRLQIDCKLPEVAKEDNFIYRGLEGLIPLLLPLLLGDKIPVQVNNPHFSVTKELAPALLQYQQAHLSELWLKIELLFLKLFQLNISINGEKQIPAQGGLAGGTVNGIASFANFEKLFVTFLRSVNTYVKQARSAEALEIKDSILPSLTDIEQQDLLEPIVLKVWGADAYAFLQPERQAFWAFRYGNRNLLALPEVSKLDRSQYCKDLESFYNLLSHYPEGIDSLDGRKRSGRKISQIYNQVEVALGFALNHSPLHLLPYQESLFAELDLTDDYLARMVFLFNHWGQMSAGLLKEYATKKLLSKSRVKQEAQQVSDYLLDFITDWFFRKPEAYFAERLIAIRGLNSELDSSLEKRAALIHDWYHYFLHCQQDHTLDSFGSSQEIPFKLKLQALVVLFNSVKSLTLVIDLIKASCVAVSELRKEARVKDFWLLCTKFELLLADYQDFLASQDQLSNKSESYLTEKLELLLNSLLEIVYELNLYLSWFKYDSLVKYYLILPKFKVSTKSAFSTLKQHINIPEIPCAVADPSQVNMSEIGQYSWQKPSPLLSQLATGEVSIRYDNDFILPLDLREILGFKQLYRYKLPERIRLTGSGSTMFICRFGQEDVGFDLVLENLAQLEVKVVPVSLLSEVNF